MTSVSVVSVRGPRGYESGLQFLFDTSTGDADPGAGEIRLNHATAASATAAYLDNADLSGKTVSTFLDTFDDVGSSSARGYIRIAQADDPSNFVQFLLTGSVVDGTGYRKLTLSGGTGPGVFTAAMRLAVSFGALPSQAQIVASLGMSANGASLVQAANYAAMRALLDLEAGTDFYSKSAADAAFQAASATLSSLAGSSANGVSLATAANYAAMRALLDLEAGTDFYSKSAADTAFQAAVASQSYTPALTFAAATPGDMTFSSGPLGRYAVIGDVCFFHAELILSSKGTGGSGVARVSLPVAARSGINPICATFVSNIDFSANYTQAQAIISSGVQYAAMHQVGDNQADATLTWALFNNTSWVALNGHYFV